LTGRSPVPVALADACENARRCVRLNEPPEAKCEEWDETELNEEGADCEDMMDIAVGSDAARRWKEGRSRRIGLKVREVEREEVGAGE